MERGKDERVYAARLDYPDDTYVIKVFSSVATNSDKSTWQGSILVRLEIRNQGALPETIWDAPHIKRLPGCMSRVVLRIKEAYRLVLERTLGDAGTSGEARPNGVPGSR
jgi:hypothetical protein